MITRKKATITACPPIHPPINNPLPDSEGNRHPVDRRDSTFLSTIRIPHFEIHISNPVTLLYYVDKDCWGVLLGSSYEK